MLLDGGAGSGNFNHAGRPGEVGGSGGGININAHSSPQTKHEQTKFKEVSPQEFMEAFKAARDSQLPENRWRVDDTHTLEDYQGDKLFVTEGGSTIAITPEGNIISVCRNTNSNDHGSALLQKAVAEGGDRLDAFGEKLYNFYSKNNFKPVSWTPMRSQYPPNDWVRARDGYEPIIFYKYEGEKNTEGYVHFLRSTPFTPDYGDAEKVRNDQIDKRK